MGNLKVAEKVRSSTRSKEKIREENELIIFNCSGKSICKAWS